MNSFKENSNPTSKSSIEPPKPTWVENQTPPQIIELVDHGIQIAEQHGFRFHLEHSDRSEAKYFYVLRDAWFGFRIANHLPYYSCSADYFQIIVPRVAPPEIFQHSLVFYAESVLRGGHVVAAPQEVLDAIEQHRTQFGSVGSNDASDIRHRHNHRAAWAYEEEKLSRSQKSS